MKLLNIIFFPNSVYISYRVREGGGEGEMGHVCVCERERDGKSVRAEDFNENFGNFDTQIQLNKLKRMSKFLPQIFFFTLIRFSPAT